MSQASHYWLTEGKAMEKYLTPREVCEIVPGMSPSLLAQLRFMGEGPKFIKPTPRKVIYRLSEIESWLSSKEKTGTRAEMPA